jgi:hypothetical protein
MPVTIFSGSRERFFVPDLLIVISVLLFFAVFRNWGDLVLMVSWVLVLGYLMLLKRFESVLHLLLATLISTLWVHFAKDYYSYQHDFVKIFGMNSIPLMAWSLTLYGLHQVCNNYKFRHKTFNFVLFFLVFLVFGIAFETVAYHVLGIRNTVTASFPGLPICDCVHAPGWMQMVYFSLGPVYYLVILAADRLTGTRGRL